MIKSSPIEGKTWDEYYKIVEDACYGGVRHCSKCGTYEGRRKTPTRQYIWAYDIHGWPVLCERCWSNFYTQDHKEYILEYSKIRNSKPEVKERRHLTFKKWYWDNHEHNLQRVQKWHDENLERDREYTKQYYHKNKKQCLEATKQWKIKNKKRRREWEKQNYIKNRDKKAKQARCRYLRNKIFNTIKT